MHIRFVPGAPILLALVLASGPAASQVLQNNPDAANQSFALQGQFRVQQQQRVSDFNTLNMQAQRNVQYHPYQGYPGEYGVVGRSRHRGGRPSRAQRGFNTSICTGC